MNTTLVGIAPRRNARAHRAISRARMHNRGAALIIALFLLATLSVGVAATWRYLNATHKETHRLENAAVVQHLAEAGLDKAISALRQNRTYAGETATPLGEGTFTVQVSAKSGGVFSIASTGRIGDELVTLAQQTLFAEMRLDASGRVAAYSWTPAKRGDTIATLATGRTQS